MDKEAIPGALALLAKLACDMAEDEELNEGELREIQDSLDIIAGAVEYQLDLIETARQAAAYQGKEVRTEI